MALEIAQISEILGLASSAVGVTGKATDTLSAMKRLFESGSTPDATEASRLFNTLATELTSANMMNVQLSEALRRLEQEVRRLDDFEKMRKQYELFETWVGDIVYKLKDEHTSNQPSHFICPVCLNQDRKVSFVTGPGSVKICQSDRAHQFRFTEPKPPVPVF